MAEGTELRGCVCRIKKCAVELVAMEEEVAVAAGEEEGEEELRELVGRELRLKATFLYFDLSRVIACSDGDERRRALTGLANKLFYFMDELDNAVKSRSVSLAQVCYSDTTHVLREVVAALVPSPLV